MSFPPSSTLMMEAERVSRYLHINFILTCPIAGEISLHLDALKIRLYVCICINCSNQVTSLKCRCTSHGTVYSACPSTYDARCSLGNGVCATRIQNKKTDYTTTQLPGRKSKGSTPLIPKTAVGHKPERASSTSHPHNL
jgi:hypothetical protein